MVFLLVINLVLLFLLLASVGRLHQERRQDMDTTIAVHNWLVQRIDTLSEMNSSALSCLVSLDAQQSKQQER